MRQRDTNVGSGTLVMESAHQFRSGKGSRDENFPVASWLVHPRHRSAILAFYEFVRVADDIADHPKLSANAKIEHLDRLEQSLLGTNDGEPEGVTLRKVLNERRLSPRHAQDLLHAFRMDATKLRYANWDELIEYCTYSAMPVGRYVLDVHGESRATWPANDALCAALQIINHLQDCGEDYRNLNRVYLPLDALANDGVSVEALGEPAASPALRKCLHRLAVRSGTLLRESHSLAGGVNDLRLALEISVIQALADRLVSLLRARDPLSERVHLSKAGVATVTLLAVTTSLVGRLFRAPATIMRVPHE
jgi:squalene synthase HpnC